MILPFEHIETKGEEYFTANRSNFSLSTNPATKLALLRGVVGCIKIRHLISQTEFEQTIDYLDLDGIHVSEDPLVRLKNYISEDITIEDLNRVFGDRTFLIQNKQFFDRLTQEFNNFYYYEEKGSHTTAFAYVYRILETVSYAFPLIYATKTNDFKGTYSLIKDYMSGNKDKGELGFFKSFVKTIFNNDPAVTSSITIDIYGSTDEIKRQFFNSILKACPDSEIFDEADTDEPLKISVKFINYSSFIINLRNRFFHLFNSGQPNLQSDDVLDADAFFSQVNKKSIYWISFILIEIFKQLISKEIRVSDI